MQAPSMASEAAKEPVPGESYEAVKSSGEAKPETQSTTRQTQETKGPEKEEAKATTRQTRQPRAQQKAQEPQIAPRRSKRNKGKGKENNAK